MSEFFKWDPKTLSVKVAKMDAEHEQLIKLMNELHTAFEQKKPKSAVAPLLRGFLDFTVQHFTDEEAFMDQSGYEGAATHKIIHKQLLNEVQKYVGEFEANGALSDAFFRFLAVWLSSHIRGIDAKYGEKKSAVA
jgi:hemerythrin-like metal-binding protein